jgi:hypothetical protein
MRRRLDRDGEQVLARWIDHYQPDKETRRLIAEAIDAYADDQAQIRFFADPDISNPSVIAIEPEARLTVHVQPRGNDQFTIARIIDERDWTED